MSAQSKHVLVVEDEPDGQEVVSRMLKYIGVSTDTVQMAEDALAHLEHSVYDAVVIDLALPQMNGLELVVAIRNNAKIAHLPCIAITAYHTTAVKQEALEAGFDRYMAKPLDDTAFLREMDKMLSA